MKIDPYYQRLKRRPMILVSGNIRCMQIFEGVVVDDGNFWRVQWLVFGNFRNKASNII